MAGITPFRAIRYDLDAVEDLGRVTSPPYDVISDAEREDLEDLSPYNIVRLILPRDEPGASPLEKYTQARALLEAWLAAGVLRPDEQPSVTVYEQRFELEGRRRVQRGVLAGVALSGEAGILPHERTMVAPVEDRLGLMRATRANLEPVFGIYDGAGPGAREAIEKAAADEPFASFTDPAGVEHRVWRLEDPAMLESLAAALRPASVVIADGHHRHRTALAYREERRAAEGPGPWDALMAFLVDRDGDPALLPIHRIVSGIEADAALERLRGSFEVEPAHDSDPARLTGEVARRRSSGRWFGMSDGTRGWLLRSADAAAERAALPADRSETWRDLDVAVLHGLVFERLLGGVQTGYVHSPAEASAALAEGRASLAVLLAPVPFSTVRAIAAAGDSMPPKSTYFFPKPRNGVAVRVLD